MISSQTLFRWWFRILAVLICLPLGMAIPGILRMPLQLLAVLLFAAALVFLKRPQYLISMVLLLFITVLYYIGSGDRAGMSAASFFFNFLCCWEIVIYSLLCFNKIITPEREIFWILVIITGITAVTTIIGTNTYPLAVREAVRADTSYSGENLDALKSIHRRLNIATWSQLYGMTFFQGSFVYFYKKHQNKWMLALIIVTEICILKAQVAFAMLLSLLVLFLIITNIRSRDYYLLPMGLAISVPIGYLLLDPVLSWAIAYVNAHNLSMLRVKLQDLYNLLVLHVSAGDAEARFDRYTDSLKGFLEYPFGLFLHPEADVSNYIKYHSDLFDFVGTLGIWGLMFLAAAFSFWLFKMAKIKNPYDHRFIFFLFLLFIMLAALNPVYFSPQIWIGVFVLPVTVILMEDDGRHPTKRRALLRVRTAIVSGNNLTEERMDI